MGKPNYEELEKQLSQTKEEILSLREIVEGTDDLITKVDDQGNILFVNSKSEKYYGIPACKCIGMSAFSFVHEEDKEKTIKKFHSYRENQTITGTFENRQRKQNGDIFYIHWTSHFHYDENGKLKFINSIGRNITDRKSLEIKLRESEERFQQAAHIARLGIWDWDIETDETSWYGEMFRIYGITPEQFTGKGTDYLEFTREDYRQNQMKYIQETIKNGIPQEKLTAGIEISPNPRELCIVRPDGTECYTLGDAITITDNNGKPQRMLGVTMDITARKKAEQALWQAKQEAESANQAKSTFIGNVSHELRSPLNAIIGFSEILAKDKTLSSKQKSFSRMIHQSSHHLLKMIDDLLNLSRIESGKIELVLQETDLLLDLQSIENIFQLLSKEKELDFITKFAPSLIRNVIVDSGKLRQVLSNIINNAIKFTDHGGIFFEAMTEPFSEKNHCMIKMSISDTGPGIDKDIENSIFTPFVTTEKNNPGGIGLGLSISKNLVEMMQGSLSFKSTPKGTTFFLEIPAQINNQ